MSGVRVHSNTKGNHTAEGSEVSIPMQWRFADISGSKQGERYLYGEAASAQYERLS